MGHVRVHRSSAQRTQDVRQGVRAGLRLAIGLAAVASVIIMINAIHSPSGNPFVAWLLVLAFYLIAGVLGGGLFGLLRPLGKRFWGRALIAYLVLVLVYAGGTVALYPLISQRPNPPSLSGLLITAAILCVIMAPVYAATAESGALPRLWDSSRD